jgi:hypothetical protein
VPSPSAPNGPALNSGRRDRFHQLSGGFIHVFSHCLEHKAGIPGGVQDWCHISRSPNRLGLVAPADRHQHRPEDLLARQAPVVGAVGEHRRDCVVALAQRPGPGRQAAEHQPGVGALQALVDILADLGELLVVDDGDDVGLLVERIADPERRMMPSIFSAQPVCRLPIGTIPTCSMRTSAGAPAVCCASCGRIPADDEIAAGSIRRPMRRVPDHS